MNTTAPAIDGDAEPVAPFAADRPAESGTSQSVLAQQRLRELILSGELPAGMRILEVPLSERLGVSRTPVRTALVRLEQEGLLEGLPNGGYRVRHFSEHDVRDAIELRGTVEGLAARLAAERGVASGLISAAREGLHAIDAALAAPRFGEAEFAVYVAHNERFHTLLAELPGSEVIRREVERARGLPFASPSAFLGVQVTQPGAREMLIVAQHQHHAVLDAIERREGARAEALMREHARIARRNMDQALAGVTNWQLVPGGALLRRAG
jgi:GntR family transcriptional regulator of vanillate catabolism